MIPFVLALLALDPATAARDLARSAAAAVAREPVSVSVRNLSSLGPADVAGIRRVFDSELKPASPPTAEIRLTISENLTQYLLVAEIRHGSDRQVLMESWPRVSPAAESKEAGPRMALEKRLLWEQDQPILDAAQTADAVVVLDSTRVLLMRGAARQVVPIPVSHPWPRDLRGRLSVSGSAFTAWLPGISCRGALQPQLTLECRNSLDPWLIGPGALANFAAAGNFFPGRIDVEPGGAHQVAPFYSAAPSGDQWVLAGVDGQARAYTHTWELSGQMDGLGSDLAGIDTPCGARLLATRATGSSEPDAIQPYEWNGGTAHPAGRPLEFTGPVTALWPAGNFATAISRDLQTGRYAAYSLVPACGD